MTDRPILMSAPMIRAILDGRQTQTRRVIKLPTKTHSGGPIYEQKDMGGWAATTIGGGGCFSIDKDGNRVPEPERPGIWHPTTGECVGTRFAVGDRLWVRESWRVSPEAAAGWHPDHMIGWIDYQAGGSAEVVAPSFEAVEHATFIKGKDHDCDFIPSRYRPGIHMPRWASRLTLLVEDVRVERLQDISEADAIAEGIDDVTAEVAARDPALRFWRRYHDGGWNGYVDHPVASYASLWTEINGAGAWEANPWVCAITFRPVLANIDRIAA